MSGDLVKVRITAPAKLGPRWLRPGDAPEVTLDELAALEAAGAVERDPDATRVVVDGAPALTLTQAEFDAVTDTLKRIEAKAQETVARAEALEVEKAALLVRAVEAEAQRDMLQGRVLELQDQLSAAMQAGEQAGAADDQQHPPGGTAAPDQPDTPEPSETAAKPAPKKGAAAKPKG